MADESRQYPWMPSTEQDFVTLEQDVNTLPEWYVPPSQTGSPINEDGSYNQDFARSINRENEFNLPNYYTDTSISSIEADGSFNKNMAKPITRSNSVNYASDFGATGVYTSYAGVDITATMVIPGQTEPIEIGELQTISYSIHRENVPVRVLGRVAPHGFVKGPRTIAGSLIFTQFDKYFFYKLSSFKNHIENNLYPLSDMLPPFDVSISFANESGSFSKLKIYGITIVDEGSTMSVDDLITEQTFTYMARGIQPLVSYMPTEIKDIIDRNYLTNRETTI